MKVDLEHLHYWMCAVRESDDPMRTLDAFWSGQIRSKEWLINELEVLNLPSSSIEIHGGWVGVLASMLFQSKLSIQNIVSVDIDPHVQFIAEEMNRIEHSQDRFRAETSNMTNRYPVTNVIINTSCEHITQGEYDVWLSHMFDDQLLVLQSNNYDIPEHVRIAQTLDEFVEQANLSTIKFKGELDLPLYKRFMVIGYK